MNKILRTLRNFFGLSLKRRRTNFEINPEEIFIDSSNLPQFDTHQFQGRFEKPLPKSTFVLISAIFIVFGAVLTGRLWFLGINKGEAYTERSEQNRLHESDVFSNRGVIFDRFGKPLAFNSIPAPDQEFALRNYATSTGVAHVLGYVKYPVKDSAGIFFRKVFIGEDGVEKIADEKLSGDNGVKIVETDAVGRIQSESVARNSVDGENVTLTIDSKLSTEFYDSMKTIASERGFSGGSAVLMDVTNGEVLVLANYPEYDPNIITSGDNDAIVSYQNDARTPFLNRAIAGLYTPGSIIKPVVALGVLEEDLINPNKQILSSGSISIPNPYFPDKKTVFNDWKIHGLVDMRRAIAVSSDVYFYQVGGGFEGQPGLGIARIEKYLRMFGLGESSNFVLPSEKEGIIPNEKWKEAVFDGDPWRVGDTYNVSIGQYGLQITPLQAARFVSAIANNGKLFTPKLFIDGSPAQFSTISAEQENFDVVHEGMRQAVTEGTSIGLNVNFVEIAGKTGTAELGSRKQFVNSWSVGFFPYENPRYAFAVVMEKGPHDNQIGATAAMRRVVDWMHSNTPEYFR